MKFKMKFFLGATAVVLLSACTSDLGWLLRFSGETPADVRELARSMQCGTPDEKSAVTVFADAKEFRQWQEQRGIKLIDSDAMPVGPYALVEMGSRPNAGFGLAISRKAGIRRDLIVLKGTFIAPTADAVTAQVVSSPCVLMGLPSGFYRGVVVFNQAGEIQATSLTKS